MNEPRKSIETLSEELQKQIKAPSSTINPDALAETMISKPADVAIKAPLPLLEVSRTEFELIKLLGEGGMGRVELMKQRSLQREVAVKSIKSSRRSPKSSEALFKEAIFTGTLEHPNIVPVHIVALNEEGSPVMVMKRVEGLSLRELLRQPTHPLWGTSDRLTRIVELLMQVCNAVHFAHNRGVLHRDIKPENIMIGEYGEVYLVDWGVAINLSEAEHTRGLAGTPSYLAPESANGEPLLRQTDIYLLGGCLYEALSGHPPHPGDNIRQVLMAAASNTIPPLEETIPKELRELCEKALQRRPSDRFESALQLREALALFLRHQGSVRLTNEALALLQELKPGAEARRLLVESRFGLRQALREWPENHEALDGMERCITQLFALELAERNVSAAVLLRSELRHPAPELQARLEDLQRSLQEEAQAKARLAHLDREQDLNISITARALLSILVTTVNLAITSYFAMNLEKVTIRAALNVSIFVTVLAAVAFFIGRKSFFKNKINQQISSTVLFLTVAHMIHRAMSLYAEPPIEQMFIEEVFFFSLAFGLAGIFYKRYLLFAGVIFLALSVLSVIHPGYASILLGLQLAVPFVAMIMEWGTLKEDPA